MTTLKFNFILLPFLLSKDSPTKENIWKNYPHVIKSYIYS